MTSEVYQYPQSICLALSKRLSRILSRPDQQSTSCFAADDYQGRILNMPQALMLPLEGGWLHKSRIKLAPQSPQ